MDFSYSSIKNYENYNSISFGEALPRTLRSKGAFRFRNKIRYIDHSPFHINRNSAPYSLTFTLKEATGL